MGDAVVYRCPGETYAISPAVHFGRLASFYPACRTCEHCGDTGPLSTRQVKQLAETRRRAAASDLFFDEGVAGVEYNELTPAVARRAARAFALHLHDLAPDPTVVVAGDGRPLSIELLVAAVEGLRHEGVHVVDLGAATAPCLAHAQYRIKTDGGLFIGNVRSEPHTASLKFWGPAGAPLSQGAGLDAVAAYFAEPPARPRAPYGRLRREQPEAAYLETLRPLFHALRPLRIILDTSCRPLHDYLTELTRHVACQFLPPSAADAAAHARLWIDGDGERFELFDERGRPVEPAALLAAFMRHQLNAHAAPPSVVLEEPAPPQIAEQLARLGVPVVRSQASRAAMHRAMTQAAAPLGGGASGRLWIGPHPALPDALAMLAGLLVLLSTSDRPLSAVASATIFDAVE